LTRFKPGNRANGSGRPKVVINLLELIQDELAEIDPETRRTKAKELISALVDAGRGLNAKANIRATQTILDRLCGPVVPVKADEVDLVSVALKVKERVESRTKP